MHKSNRTVTRPAGNAAAAAERKSRRQLVAMIGGGILLTAGIVVAVIACWPVKPPDPKAAPQEALKFVASDQFKRLPVSSQLSYMESFGDNRRAFFEQSRKLSEPERQALRENMGRVFQARMTRDLRKFFQLSKEEQMAQLDKEIAERQAREKEWAARRAASGNNGRPGGGNRPPRTPPSAQQQRERDAAMNPSVRAQMQVKRAMMEQRAAQTGKK